MSSSALTSSPSQAIATAAAPRRWRIKLPERTQSFLLLLPSFIAIVVFVYAFIGATFYVSISGWRTLKVDLSLNQPVYRSYLDMFSMPRFQADLRNTLVFTILFMALAVLIGLLLAILLDRNLMGRVVFRNVFLFPYALSFVVTGVAWRWIFNPETGINLFFNILGINPALQQLGLAPLKPGWTTDPTVMLQVNQVLTAIWPEAANWQIKLGIPVAMIPVAIAAVWQLSGFVMAMYIGGMATISDEVRQAARIDGAKEWQVYRHVIIPMLRPVTISVVVLLLHTSLKIFDLVFTMTGPGPGFATDVPSIFVFEYMFRATRYNLASAAAIFMLVLSGLVVIPYLRHSFREES
jgi:glucose/mannose transport system permease protein